MSIPIELTGLIRKTAANAYCQEARLHVNLPGGEAVSDVAFRTYGGNISSLHLNFMIGSKIMNVDGHKNGAVKPLRRPGEWVNCDPR